VTDSILILRGLEELYPEIRFVETLRIAMEKHPNANWGDAMSRGQIKSKQWLIHELVVAGHTQLGKVMVCCGWLGILSRLIFDNEHLVVRSLISIDLDLVAVGAAFNVNIDHDTRDHDTSDEHPRFFSYHADAYMVSYNGFDTIINTSCEHFADFGLWWDKIPSGTRVILQSNNFVGPEEHVNTVNSVDELIAQAPMTSIIYQGTLPTHKYDRYMVIGVK
jgi:hypothetical protein